MARNTVTAVSELRHIPVGHYHDVMLTGHPIRRAWHQQKFTRILELLPTHSHQSILDIGCFAGSFLSLVDEQRFSRQVGVDILPEQVAYAQNHFGTSFRQFVHVPKVSEISNQVSGTFDCVTLIEVIEHLQPTEISYVIEAADEKLRPGGRLVLSTPNYTSAWPAIETLLNRFSDVTYEEQHITRFNWFNCETKLNSMAPVLSRHFELELKTTTHFISPFLAFMGVGVSSRISSWLPHQKWKMPFGNLLMLSFLKK